MAEKQHDHAGMELHANHFFNRVRRQPNDAADEGHSSNEALSAAPEEAEQKALDGGVNEEAAGMPHEARRVLVYLMRQGTLLANENAKSFEALCRFEKPIRQHLSDMYLSLVIDHKFGVAYILNAEPEQNEAASESANDFPSLIRKRTLTLFDTLVLLILRKYYQEREQLGEQKIMIDAERIQVNMIPFVPISNHESKDKRKLGTTLDKFSEKKILKQMRGEEGRYEITPLIRYAVNAEFLAALLEEYQILAKQALEKDLN